MKIVTWNINGLRASKLNLHQLLKLSNADIVCLQETKITKDLLTSDIALVDGYNSYFSFSQKRAGYSGVATFCKNTVTPKKAQAGLGSLHENEAGSGMIACYGNLNNIFSSNRLNELDSEGRTIITQHEIKDSDKNLVIINVYCPRADLDDKERYDYKIDFYKALEERAKSFISIGNYVIVLGDINASHKTIDHCDPSDQISFFDNKSRAWLDSFVFNDGDYSTIFQELEAVDKVNVTGGCFVDSFRYFYPSKPDMFTCWCTSNRARETNYGTRIDYIFCDKFLAKTLKSSEILTEFLGSDHCPVEAMFNINVVSSKNFPSLCTNFYSTFGGKQLKMSSYFNEKKSDKNKKRTLKDLDDSSKQMTIPTKKINKVSQMKLTCLFSKSEKAEENSTATSAKNTNNFDIKTPSCSIKSKPNKEASLFWKTILKGPEPPPLCKGHNEPCVKRTVKKEGPNLGKQFYCCSRPEGHKNNKEARCQFFKWC